MQAENVDVVVIGAGVIGLAVARTLALKGRDVLVLEACAAIGMETSSRNSEVIHAGIYYPQGSLKAKLCVLGKERLYDYCQDRNIDFKQIGKLIVGTSSHQLEMLSSIKSRAEINGVTDLRYLTKDEIKEKEPLINAEGGLYSPSTGIIDSHGLMLSLQGDLERAGGIVALKSPVTGGIVKSDGIGIHVTGSEECQLHAKLVINAAGLKAVDVANTIKGLPKEHIPTAYFAKGTYFSLQEKVDFNHLIYPVPEKGGLGIHLTLDLAGQARFGPNVEWINSIDYTFNDAFKAQFAQAIGNYYPSLDQSKLQPAYTGIRPKISGPGVKDADFLVSFPSQHGVAGLVNLFGIESPGLTSCLAISDYVVRNLENKRR